MKRVEQEIADRIENPLEEGTPLFQRVFERCLSSQRLQRVSHNTTIEKTLSELKVRIDKIG